MAKQALMRLSNPRFIVLFTFLGTLGVILLTQRELAAVWWVSVKLQLMKANLNENDS